MPIYLPEDPRSKALAQFGASLGQSAGQALSAKTLKSMFQDVIDAGGSPLTAMQRIMPYDPELADKLGDQYSQQEGEKFLRDIMRQTLGIEAPEGVSAALMAGAAKVHIDDQRRKAEEQRATEQAKRDSQRLALEERRVALAERPTPVKPEPLKTEVQTIGERKVLINSLTGETIKDLGMAPKSGGASGQTTNDKIAQDLLNEYQGNLSKIASIKAGENIWLPEDATRGEAIKMIEERNNQIKKQYGKLGGDMGNLGVFTDNQIIKDLSDMFPPAENKGVVKRDTQTGIEYISDGKEWKVRGL